MKKIVSQEIYNILKKKNFPFFILPDGNEFIPFMHTVEAWIHDEFNFNFSAVYVKKSKYWTFNINKCGGSHIQIFPWPQFKSYDIAYEAAILYILKNLA